MKRRVLLSSVTGSVILAAAMLPATGALAADQMPVKAKVAADTGWYYYGDIEFGGRFFVNNPTKDGLASAGQKSLGKYYEYSDIRPGMFLNGWLGAGTKDGRWKFDLSGDNVGYEDQRIELSGSKAGEFYFTGSWDQTPHIYSTNAQTMYRGLDTNSLVLPPNLAATLNGQCGNATACADPTGAQQTINNNLYTTELGIRRDTAAADFRWTPTSNWDVNVAYSNMHRTGNQAEGVVFGPGTSNIGVAQVPKPVNDTTQNYAASGEYSGTSPWGKAFTFKLGYTGSTYTDKWSSYTAADPFCQPGGAAGSPAGLCGPNAPPTTASTNYAPSALMSLWPDNQANGFNATLGADLPVKSRYVGTVAYNMMRQNQAFLPFTNNATPFLGTQNTTPPGSPNPMPTLPASSLNGAINTLLINNVLTTQITPELKSKLTYRYYDFNNNTPELLFNDWIVTDTTSANNRSAAYAPVRSLSISYNKQNAGADLVWSPNRQWDLGAAYGYERYNWTRADADVTHENAGRVFADYKPWSWLTARSSYFVSDRHYNNYDYRGYVGNFQWADTTCQSAAGCGAQYSTAMRQFYLDNRQRQIGKFSVAVDLQPGFTITPSLSYQEDNYSISATEAGLTRTQVIKSGVEVAYVINPWSNILLAYMNEQYRQNLKFTTPSGSGAMTAANTWHADIRDNVNTLMAAVNWGAIPDKLDIRFSYTMSLSNNSQPFNADNGTTPSAASGGQPPDVKGQWSRFETLAKYTFDKSWTHAMGFNGEAYAKLRYVWERNSVNNLDQDMMVPYFTTLGGATTLQRMTWMAYDNPNYNVHLIGASLGLKW